MIAIIIALCRCLEYNSVLACTVYYVGYVLCNLYTVEMFNAKVHSNCEFLFKKKSDNIEADLMIAYYRNEIGNKQTIAVWWPHATISNDVFVEKDNWLRTSITIFY